MDKIVHRLDPEMLAAVQRDAGQALSVNSNTTPLEAGFQLGVARVIEVLRKGFVVAVAPTRRE